MDTQQKIIDTNSVFSDRYLNSKAMYMYSFRSIPCISFVNHINGEKAFKTIKERYCDMIRSVHSYRSYDRKDVKTEFDDTVMVLNNECVLEFGSGYCEILHSDAIAGFVKDLAELLKSFKERQRRKPLEINLIVKNNRYMGLRAMEIKRTKLDLDLYYEDDFIETDEIIRKRLNQKNDKGIVLLHGLPGTGKTTYLRHLIGKIKKRVLFLSPNIATSLVDPEFIDLLIDNPNCVVIVEDAENIIMDRRSNPDSSVSNLLNISDGLLADFLNVQLICTFNSSLTMVDSALMRKGRLIAKYEFGKLSVRKAQRLSDRLGYRNLIVKPMTIAEITNPEDTAYKTERTEIIGFKRQLIEN
jgi:hypothetical protein